MNVYDYFVAKLGDAPSDETLKQLPVDSVCGAECKTAIDRAAAFIESVRLAGIGDPSIVVDMASDAVEVFWRG